jgi:hypothetical protein
MKLWLIKLWLRMRGIPIGKIRPYDHFEESCFDKYGYVDERMPGGR